MTPSAKGSVLIVEESPVTAEVLVASLEARNYQTSVVFNEEDAMQLYLDGDYAVVVTRADTKEIDGLRLTKKLVQHDPNCMVIVISSFMRLDQAVDSLKSGAVDYLKHPVNLKYFVESVDEAVLARQVNFRSNRATNVPFDGDQPRSSNILRRLIASESPKMKHIINLLENTAPKYNAILIQGESGTLKNMIAELLHHWGDKYQGPLYTIDVATKTEENLRLGLIGSDFQGGPWLEHVEKGTLVLQNIEHLSDQLQRQLSLLIKDRLVDTNLICTTTVDLDAVLDRGAMIESLFFQVTTALPIIIPPLREHIEDLPLLINQFVDEAYNPHFNSKDIKFSASALRVLRQYTWPGNIRELKEVVTQVVSTTTSKRIHTSQLPFKLKSVNSWPSLDTFLAEKAAEYIESVRRVTNNDTLKTLSILDITPEYLSEVENTIREHVELEIQNESKVEGAGEFRDSTEGEDESKVQAEAAETKANLAEGPSAFMMVKDEETMRHTVSEMIEKYNCQVVAVSEGLDGILSIKTNDEQMKGMLFDDVVDVHSRKSAIASLRNISDETDYIFMASADGADARMPFTVLQRERIRQNTSAFEIPGIVDEERNVC